jgi:hypothetical protein
MELSRPRLISRMVVKGSRIVTESLSWADYWMPSRGFFAAEPGLAYRLRGLKAAWLDVLRHNANEHARRTYCWRYFDLLHHALALARRQPGQPDATSALQRILGLEVFVIRTASDEGEAGAVVFHRNPVCLLGRLPCIAPPPSPKHVPLVLAPDRRGPFYHYRRLVLDPGVGTAILLFPSVDLRDRPSSFVPIDRFARLLGDRPDPYWRPRASVLARRDLLPLLRLWIKAAPEERVAEELVILDLGAGTGHLAATAWRRLRDCLSRRHCPSATLHFVDSTPPCAGRSFGLRRENEKIAHVEWTTADYRRLLDDESWLRRNGPFDWGIMVRLLGNASNFAIESVAETEWAGAVPDSRCQPHVCLSPRFGRGGSSQLEVRTVRRKVRGGTAMPQFSLGEYFDAMRIVLGGAIDEASQGGWHLPIRRFNPASLTTFSGRSVVAQLMKAAKAIVIEDIDLTPEQLLTHREQFGLAGTGAVHCTNDVFVTASQHYIITKSSWAACLPGNRLW